MKRSHAGFTLVEVVVAMFVLAVVFAGAAATVIAVTGVVQVNETRAAGSNVAQAEIELLRARPYDELEGLVGVAVAEREIDGRPYRVETSISYASLDEDVGPCAIDPSALGEQVIQVDLAVWPAHDPARRSTSSTLIARQPDELPAGVGNLSVYVTDEQEPPQPVDGVIVTLRNSVTGVQADERHTDADGCVIFPAQQAGNYEVQIRRDGTPEHVGPRPASDETTPTRDVGIVAGTTSIVEFRFAPAGRFEPITAITPAAPDLAVLPDQDLEVTVSRMGRQRVGEQGGVIGPVWPGDWQAWAGSCPDADPEALMDSTQPRWPGASRQPRVMVQRWPAATALEVRLGVVELRDGGGTGEPVFTGVTTVNARIADPDMCPEGQRELTFSSERPSDDGYDPEQGPLRIALPYGVWDLEIISIPSANPGSGATTTRSVAGVVVAPPTDAVHELIVVEVPR